MTPAPLDTVGIWEATAGLPEQIEEAARTARDVEGLPEHDAVENVVVVGMGGSGIAGDILLPAPAPSWPSPPSP